jgi:hypothetical protein
MVPGDTVQPALLVGAGVTRPDAVEALLLGTARRPKSRASHPAAGLARIDDRYGSGIVDANAALAKARSGKGAGALGLAAAAAFAGMGGRRRRRGIGTGGVRPGSLLVGIASGASGLFFLPWLAPSAPSALSASALDTAASVLGAGNPLVWSVALPLSLAALLYGVARARGFLAGFAFGTAGALAFAAIAYVADIRLVPDFLDRAWLFGHALLAAGLGNLIARRS